MSKRRQAELIDNRIQAFPTPSVNKSEIQIRPQQRQQARARRKTRPSDLASALIGFGLTEEEVFEQLQEMPPQYAEKVWKAYSYYKKRRMFEPTAVGDQSPPDLGTLGSPNRSFVDAKQFDPQR